MTETRSKAILGITVVLAAAFGLWISQDILASVRQRNKDAASRSRPMSYSEYDAPNLSNKKAKPEKVRKAPQLDELLHGVARERVVRFDDEDSYRKFLASLDGSKLRLLGKLDQLRAARIGFDNLDDLDGLLDDDNNFANYRVSIPELPQVDAQPSAVGFGRNTLEWLGITGDNSEWGKGVRIAILDTGVGKHAALASRIREIDLITGDGPAIDLHGHGTAVASLIIGADGITQGITPAAELLSIRIADDSGTSNSFLLAEGIVRAVDEGAQIINISMGSYGDSPLVQDAVAYAAEKQVVIVAAAGNEGLDTPAYPAAYEGVIAVGAIDATGQHLNFSNRGDAIDIAAPGFEIVSAWLDDQYTSFTGTSASAPLVTSAIAATMTEAGPLLPAQAVNVLNQNMNAAGQPGDDPLHGGGNLDVDRLVNSNVSGRYDLAVASNWYEPPGDDVVGSLQIEVQNQGTEPIAGATIDVTINGDIFPMTLPRLQPGGTEVLTLPINEPTGTESISIRSSLNLNGNEDLDPSNNILAGNVRLITEEPVVPESEFEFPDLGFGQ